MGRISRRSATAFLVAGCMFMEILDATVIATALPAIAHEFDVAAAHLSVGVSAYLVALTVFIPISSWTADRFGARRIFSLAIVVFTLASVLCALSHSLMSFTFARILQGLGGAMMVPVGRLVVLQQTPKSELVRAIAILTWPALVAPILGPVLGGWIATVFSWHWIFLLNVPLGMLALLASFQLLPATPKEVRPFDFAGFIYSGTCFGLLMAGIESASRNELSLWLPLGLLSGGVFALFLTVTHLKRASHPLFNLAPLAIQTFRLSMVGGSLYRISIATAPFLLPLMFQLGFGYSALESGALLLWLFLGNLCMKPATTWVMNQFGFKHVLVVNGLMITAGFVAIALFTEHTPTWLIAVVLFVCGLNRSMQFTAMNTLGFSDVPPEQMRDANTLQSVCMQMNFGAGIALGALALALAHEVTGAGVKASSAVEFQLAFVLVGILSLCAQWDIFKLPVEAGSSVLKNRARSS